MEEVSSVLRAPSVTLSFPFKHSTSCDVRFQRTKPQIPVNLPRLAVCVMWVSVSTLVPDFNFNDPFTGVSLEELSGTGRDRSDIDSLDFSSKLHVT